MEGVEFQPVAETGELGSQFGQGYFFGLPKAACLHKSKDRTHTLNVAELRSRLRAQVAGSTN